MMGIKLSCLNTDFFKNVFYDKNVDTEFPDNDKRKCRNQLMSKQNNILFLFGRKLFQVRRTLKWGNNRKPYQPGKRPKLKKQI